MRQLSDQEVDHISEIAIKAAEDYIFSKVSKKEILDIRIIMELHYEEGLDLDILVELDLDSLSSANEKITEKATEHALAAFDAFMNEIS